MLNRAASHTALGLVSARERAANDFFAAAPLALAIRSAAWHFRRFKPSPNIRSTTRDFRLHSLHPGMLRPGLGNLPSAIREQAPPGVGRSWRTPPPVATESVTIHGFLEER
jgi:hypothetical protein